MLAADNIVLCIGGEEHLFRPSLRAAIRLERKFGLTALAKGIAGGSLTTLSAILTECGAPSLILHGLALGDVLPEATTAAAALLSELYGLDDEAPEPAFAAVNSTLTHSAAFAQLYRAATGTLGWSPSQAFDAAPSEITEAIEGRHAFVGDLLRAVFGSKTDDGDNPSPTPANQNESAEAFLDRADAARDTSALSSLRGTERAA